VEELVTKGYLQRKPNPDDRRYVDIELTEKGEQAFKEIQLTSRHYFEAILDTIPEDKREITLEGIQIFSTALYQVFKKNTKNQQ
jgi:DNA-binding MarR family transcriptional regulator